MEPWRLQARCLDADPDSFFPPTGDNGLAAKKICASCPVTYECGESALNNHIEEGVWGGMSGIQRLVILGRRKDRRRAA